MWNRNGAFRLQDFLVSSRNVAKSIWCKISGGAVPAGSRRLAAAPLWLNRLPEERFADRVEVVPRDARAAATWSRLSRAISAPELSTRKPCDITGQILVRAKGPDI
jgi:hypothetical protein